MKNIKMTLAYDGTRYLGWQKQKNTGNTIQETIERTFFELTGESVEIIASGRTDAGVHAYGQVINFMTESALSPEELKTRLNTSLPSDIAVLSAERADERFHARYNAKTKTYVYRINSAKDPFTRKYAYFSSGALDLHLMREAAAILEGAHDFLGFSSLKRPDKSTVRTMLSVEITGNGFLLEIRYTADGFLFNMARIITGTLIEIGRGERPAQSINDVFNAKDRRFAGFTAPPHGLALLKVGY